MHKVECTQNVVHNCRNVLLGQSYFVSIMYEFADVRLKALLNQEHFLEKQLCLLLTQAKFLVAERNNHIKQPACENVLLLGG